MSATAVSVVLPTYNERDNIDTLLRLLDEALGSIDATRELIVVDDSSPDGTGALVNELSRELPSIRLIERAERGLTGAIQAGIEASAGEVIVWMDCDLSMPPDMVPTLVSAVQQDGFDVAVGSRYVRGGGVGGGAEAALVGLQRFLTGRLNRWIADSTDAGFYDWTSGFIAVRREKIVGKRLRGRYGDYFIRLMADLIAGGARFVEIPYRTVPREYGRSKTASSLGGMALLGLGYLSAFRSARRRLRDAG